MVVDQDGGAVLEPPAEVPGDMDLPDRCYRDVVEVSVGVEAVIEGADVDVVDVQQKTAPGAAGHLGHKRALRDRADRETDSGRRVIAAALAPEWAMPAAAFAALGKGKHSS